MVGASFFVVSLSASKYLSLSRLFVLFRVGRDGLFYLMNESRSCTVPIGPLAANSILSPPQVKNRLFKQSSDILLVDSSA